MIVTSTSPPGMRTRSVPVDSPAWRNAATTAATVPVPHERVSPTPRSCTRIETAPSAGAVSTSTLTPSGNCAASNGHRRCDVECQQVVVGQRRVDARQMRIADVDGKPGEASSADDRRAGADLVGLAHLDRDVSGQIVDRMHDDGTRARQRSHDEFIALLEAGHPKVVREDPDAVSTHLRDRSVGVAVVHVPVARLHSLGDAVEYARGQRARGRGHPQHAVGADAATAIAQRGHRGRRQRQGGVDVGQQHEVVLRTVPLGELHLIRIRVAIPAGSRRRFRSPSRPAR